MPSNVESSVRRTDTYFARETLDSNANPQTPTDPTFNLYSTVVNSEEIEPSAEFDNRLGLGNYLPVEKKRQQETHELTVAYDLQRFPVDASGNPQDAFADVVLRDIDNRIENTHTFLEVSKKETILPESTWHYRYFSDEELGNTHPSGTDPGATSKPTRTEHYGRGCIAEEATMELAPEDASVISSELQYVAHKFRRYQIDQPAATETIAVKSTNSADTGATVDIETTDGATSESLTLDSSDATVLVTSSNTYGSLRVSLPTDISGDLEVYTYDSTNAVAKQLLTVIRGADARDGIEGDRGVPLVGAGTFKDDSSLGDGIPALGSNLSWDGHPAAENVSSTTITGENEVETNATDSGLVPDIHTGSTTISLESTVFGETESPQMFDDYLYGREGVLSFAIEGGSVDIPRAYISDGGTTEKEAGSAVMQVEVTWNTLMPDDGSNPLQFNPA